MKVEELIIDGFKSYATRTVISGWDSLFNAITGLNGSGKSNILDAICFVLGIASMSTVRASNLQDLIYKRGQAGVTKASVTIVFDNSDKALSPIGFENSQKISITRQIILGGTSKYLVNGHKAQQQTVLSLFQSVQLNINNPNFLIMQGKITKVLNMKPLEILALIEEAAGTRTFEDRKEKAKKTMAKKEAKLVEIRSLLNEEIEPKLERLRSEKRTFLEYQKVQTDLEKLSRIISSHKYRKYSEQFDRYSALRGQNELVMNELEALIQRLTDETLNLIVDLEAVRKQKEAELLKGGHLETLEKEESTVSNNITRLSTTRDLAAENGREESSRIESLEREISQLQENIENRLAEFTQTSEQFEVARNKLEQLKDEYNKKEELFTTLQTGVSAKGGTDGGYLSHLKEAKEKLNNSRNSIKQAELKIQHLTEKLKNDQEELSKARKENQGVIAQIEAHEQRLSDFEEQFAEHGYDAAAHSDLKSQESLIRKQINAHHEQLARLRREVGNIDFQYSRPSPDFDDSSVKGVAVQLFNVGEQHLDKAVALQVCAGGRLYNVVVDNTQTASMLLERGNLKRRVTIIPLDKISARSVPASTVALAKQKCPEKVELALNLVDFDNELHKAMTYIFGSTFICMDPDTAKAITFDPKIRTRSITIDGDTYDPEGNLSGGSRRESSSLLLSMQKYNNLSAQIQKREAKLAEVRHHLKRMDELSELTREIQNQVNLCKHELSILQRKLDNNSSAMIIKENELNLAEIERQTAYVAQEKENLKSLQAKTTAIENDIADFNKDKGSKLKELEAELALIKKAYTKQEKEMNDISGKFQGMKLEIEQFKLDIESAKDAVSSSKTNKAECDAVVEEKDREIAELQDQLTTLQAELADERQKMIGFNDEINVMSEILAKKNEQLSEAKLKVQELNHDLEKANAAYSTIKRLLDEMIKSDEWLTDTDVTDKIIQQYPDVDIDEYESQLSILQERSTNMKRKVNSNIMSMIDNVEKKEQALKHMVRTIEKDKTKIENTIEKLNGYKRNTLNATYQKVSDDFGNIFADLLPGSYAKLVPVDMMDVTRGLEVKVKLGPVWKESLVELSGGQRSLIALSLIMALLQFKPAPMYILDEVDAALDMSHTQNIGHLIKTRFKGSQFIVVSLKEGMFTNANRVFRTRFQDGTSVVSSM